MSSFLYEVHTANITLFLLKRKLFLIYFLFGRKESRIYFLLARKDDRLSIFIEAILCRFGRIVAVFAHKLALIPIIPYLTKAVCMNEQKWLDRYEMHELVFYRRIGTERSKQRIHRINTRVPSPIFLADEEHQVTWDGIFLTHLMESPFLRVSPELIAVTSTMLVVVERRSGIDTWQRLTRCLRIILTRTFWQVNAIA